MFTDVRWAYPGPVQLQVLSWSAQSITAYLPANYNGLVTLAEQAIALDRRFNQADAALSHDLYDCFGPESFLARRFSERHTFHQVARVAWLFAPQAWSVTWSKRTHQLG